MKTLGAIIVLLCCVISAMGGAAYMYSHSLANEYREVAYQQSASYTRLEFDCDTKSALYIEGGWLIAPSLKVGETVKVASIDSTGYIKRSYTFRLIKTISQ